MSKVITLTDELELLLEDVARLTNAEQQALNDAGQYDRQAQAARERAADARTQLLEAQIKLASVIVQVPVQDAHAPSFPEGTRVRPIRLVNYNGGLLAPTVTTETTGITGATDSDGDVYVLWDAPFGYSNYMNPNNLVRVTDPERFVVGDKVIAIRAEDYCGRDLDHVSPGDVGIVTFVYNDGDYDVDFDPDDDSDYDKSFAMSPNDLRRA